jgi:hypothetical protein
VLTPRAGAGAESEGRRCHPDVPPGRIFPWTNPNSNPHYLFWSSNGGREAIKRGWLGSLALRAALKNPDGILKRRYS